MKKITEEEIWPWENRWEHWEEKHVENKKNLREHLGHGEKSNL